jgi:hypothetical protein
LVTASVAPILVGNRWLFFVGLACAVLCGAKKGGTKDLQICEAGIKSGKRHTLVVGKKSNEKSRLTTFIPMETFRHLLKTPLRKRWFRASLAGLILTAGAGAGYVCETSAATNDVIPPLFFGLHGMSYPANGTPVPYQPWGLIRTWDHWGNGNISWSGLEPSRGTFNWTAMDATVNAITNSNVAILHCFGWGPSWAGGTAPTNIQDWDDFITAFVNRYHTKIKYLETWNEAMAGEGFYSGTVPQLALMGQHLYTITKSIDPTVTVLTPDATGGSYNMSVFYTNYFAAGGTNADAIAFHGYCSMAGLNQITPPEEIIGIVTALKGAMNAYGQGSKPIFCTEGDWGSEGSGGNCPTTDDCVAFMARHYLLMWSLGVSSYAWYDWENNNGSWQWGQMWDPTSGLNAAGVAYQQLYSWMVGATMSQPYTVTGSVYTCGFTRPGGYQALAVWDTNRASGSAYTVPNGYVQYRDLAGNLYSISGTTVTIGIKPILLENSTAVTPNSVTPVFSGLTSHTNTYGATVTLTGTVSTNGSYLPSGTIVSVTINGLQQNTTISDLTGEFSINYNTAGLPASGSPYAVTYASAAAFGFNAATDTSTTLKVNPLAVVLTGSRVYDGTTNASASVLSVSNLVDSDNLTLSGSVGLAGASIGTQAITSFGSLSLGGTAAANYTLTGASGSVTILPVPVTPFFSGLTSRTNPCGSPVALSGTVGTNGTYPASGTVITVTIDGTPQSTTISDSSGDFSISYTNFVPVSGSPHAVTYVSAAAVGFNAATNASTTLRVTQGTSLVATLPTATAITIGQTLAGSTLIGGAATNADGASVGGGFAFTTPGLQPTNAGSTNVSVTFTPTDTTDYTTATATVSVTVNPTGGSPYYLFKKSYSFDSSSDTTNWGNCNYVSKQGSGATATYTNDAPANGPSAGSVLWTELFGGASGVYHGGIEGTNYANGVIAYLNLTNYTALEFDIKVPSGSRLDSGSPPGLTQFEICLHWMNNNAAYQPGTLYAVSTNNGWRHMVITNSNLGGSANWGSIWAIEFFCDYDSGFAANNTTNTLIEISNIKFTGAPGVTQATPLIATLPTASAITYGQTLASSTLGGGSATNAAGASVGGSFAWTTPSTAPNAGTPGESVTFTPTDTTDYNTATANVNVTVNPRPVVLTGTRAYDGTTNAAAAILSLANLVGSDSVTLSGSVGLAGAAVGAEAITDFSGLTLGGGAVGDYTLAGASGTVMITGVALIGLSASGSQFIFSYPTVSGQTYQLEYATDLSSGAWLPVGDPVPGTGASISVTNSISSSMQMFFRLSITPTP